LRVIVIGGSGHIGTYLTPRLVDAGHEVVCVSRGQQRPYRQHPAWRHVEQRVCDRKAEEAAGVFGLRIAELAPEAVIDLTCYHLESAQQLGEALRGRVRHFLHCGTIWVHGPAVEVPITEEQPRRPISDYGTRKAAIENYLLAEARLRGFPATIIHPGHLVGEGWVPLNPAAHFNPKVFEDLARGEEVLLPNLGRETLHHVHAGDVAEAFLQALGRWSASVGESFHVVSPAAVSMAGYAEAVAGWFGQTPRLRFLPWEEWRKTVTEREAAIAWDHIARSPVCSIAKAERLLDFHPRYRSLDAIRESLLSLDNFRARLLETTGSPGRP
jgi:nucleoside-diphosphate-sugar epimerase